MEDTNERIETAGLVYSYMWITKYLDEILRKLIYTVKVLISSR